MHEKLTVALNTTGASILRVVVGVVFVAHGWRKIMAGFDAVSSSFDAAGIPAPLPAAILVAIVEFVGGVLLILGLKTRLAVIPLAITMAVAMTVVHLKNGFFLPEGYEFTLVLLAALITLGLVGPGPLSVDRFLGRSRKAGGESGKKGEKKDAASQTIKREGTEPA